LRAALENVTSSGVYEAQLSKNDGGVEKRLFGVNVPAGEGDLAIADRETIDKRLAGNRYEFQYFDELSGPDQMLAGFHLRDALLGVLVIILLVEQLLALKTSYHPASKPVR
jgi:hypothetical protein